MKELMKWHFVAVLVLFVELFVLFRPQIEKGYVLFMPDILSWWANSREAREWQKKTGEVVFWNTRVFSGMPSYFISMGEADRSVVRYLMKLLVPSEIPGGGAPWIVAVGFVGMYVLGLVMGLSPLLAMLAGVGFSAATFNISSLVAGHLTKTLALSCLPYLLVGTILTLRGRYLAGVPFVVLFASFMVKTNHYQIIYYSAVVVLVLWLVFLVKKEMPVLRFVWVSAVLLVCAVLAVATHLFFFLLTREYATESMRGARSELSGRQETKRTGLPYDYAFQWSYGVLESFTLIIPDFVGGGMRRQVSDNEPLLTQLRGKVSPEVLASLKSGAPLYWGSMPFTDAPVYAGAVIVLGVVLALMGWKHLPNRGAAWWLVIVSVLMLTLAWGKHFFVAPLFFKYAPYFNKFRTPMMALMVLQVTLPLLAAMGFSSILTISESKAQKLIVRSVIVLGGVVLFWLLLGGSVLSFRGPQDTSYPEWFVAVLEKQRHFMLRSDAFRSLVLILASGAVLWASVRWGWRRQLVWGFVVLLTVVDLLGVNLRYISERDFVPASFYDAQFIPDEIDRQIMADTTLHFRVIDYSRNPFTDAFTSYWHRNAGGYHPAKLQRYQELIDSYLVYKHLSVLGMLNVKYIIDKDREGRRRVYVNPFALGPAWCVQGIRWAKNADEEMHLLGEVSLRDTAVVRATYKASLDGQVLSQCSVTLTKYEPNRAEYMVSAEGEALLVLSEIFYPHGWKAYIDGKETEILRVNYLLRGVHLPAGTHTLRLEMNPSSYRIGIRVSVVASWVVLLIVVGCVMKGAWNAYTRK